MAENIRFSAMVSGAAAPVFAATLCGCATFQPVAGRNSPPPNPAPQHPAVEELPPVDKVAVLASVQEFLERTEMYDVSAIGTPSQAPSDEEITYRTPLPAPLTEREPQRPSASPKQVSTEAEALPQTPAEQVSIAPARVTPSAPTPALPVVRSVSIRETPKAPNRAAEQPFESSATNVSMETSVDPVPTLADQLLADLEAETSDVVEFDSEWRKRLMLLALHRDVQAGDISTELAAEPRDLLTAFIGVATAVRQAALDPWQAGQPALDRVNELRALLTRGVDPTITAVALCNKVITFGVYEEMPGERFVAGQAVPTIIYSEIENIQSDLSEEGRFVTRLGTRLELLTGEGQSVWQHEEPEIVDTCRRKRRDFFLAQRVTLPATVPAGEYVLKVFVEDKLSGQASEAAYPLVIHSKLTAAPSG